MTRPPHPALRLTVRWTGHFLALAGVVFIGWHLVTGLRSSGATHEWGAMLAPLAFMSAGYTIAALLLAAGWHWMAAAAGLDSMTWRKSWRIFGRSQIGKYFPGNVLHILTRHGMGREHGASHQTLIASTVLEFGGVLVAAVVIGAIFTPRSLLARIGSGPLVQAVPFALILALAVTVVAAAVWLRRRHGLQWTQAAVGLCFYLLFFLSVGGLAALLLRVVAPESDAQSGMVIGAYAVAWALGFCTPGAPGGLGVRDAALLLFLAGLAPAADLAVFVLLFRLVTVLGDVGLFGAASIGGELRQPQTPATHGTHG